MAPSQRPGSPTSPDPLLKRPLRLVAFFPPFQPVIVDFAQVLAARTLLDPPHTTRRKQSARSYA
jgi:hypothetical protein